MRATLSSAYGKSLPPLSLSLSLSIYIYIEREEKHAAPCIEKASLPSLYLERHSLLCVKEESTSSLYRRETLLPLDREGVSPLSM